MELLVLKDNIEQYFPQTYLLIGSNNVFTLFSNAFGV